MTTEMNGLFTGSVATTTNGTLAGTQQLTNLASTIATTVLDLANADLTQFADRIKLSLTATDVLDKLVNDLYPIAEVDVTFLKALTEDVLEGMLKSQQSKRSRCKSKEMTMENYTSMMTAAIAEMLLRLAMGKDKGTFGGRSSSVAYTDDRLQKLAEDQEALRKEIRNVQSKKSIMKSKAGFTEADEKWLALLVAEEQLKSIRSDAPGATIKVIEDPLRNELKEMLAELDYENMSAKNLKVLVTAIKDSVWSDVTVDPETESEEV